MSALARDLEIGLDIVRETRVTSLEHLGDAWRLVDGRYAPQW